MKFKLIPDKKFIKHYAKLTAAEKKQTDAKLIKLAENPLHPSLRTKRIQGTESLYESSVNMDIRLIWHYEEEQIILMLDIGRHDILNQC
ncbi:MAG: cytotoxin [Oscillospiraceae bacterium]|nr:cytotoxin [Oscillospiraceae bacterium]